MSMNIFEWGDFSEKQLMSIHDAQARQNLWHGAVRSGKTIGSIVRWLQFLGEKKRAKGHFLMTGVTIGTLKDNILDVIESMVGPENYHYSAGARQVHIFGTRVLIRGASDESSEKKIRGLTLKGHYGDECTLWPQNYYKQGMTRLSVEGAKFFGTTNPDSPYHWLRQDYLLKSHGSGDGSIDMRDFHFELADNLTLPEAYVEALAKEYIGLWHKRFILGLWVVAEGAIYDMFDDKAHVIQTWESVPGWGRPERPPFEKIVAGIDHGASNPTAMILVGLYQGKWYAFAEHRHEGQSNGGISRTNNEHYAHQKAFLENGGYLPGRNPGAVNPITPRWTVLDPSAAAYRAELKRHGWPGTKEIENADNDVLQGIQVVSTALGSGQLIVHASCKQLIQEFMTYIWDPEAIEKEGRDKPIKLHDHSLDALRYALMKAIGRRRAHGAVPLPKGS